MVLQDEFAPFLGDRPKKQGLFLSCTYFGLVIFLSAVCFSSKLVPYLTLSTFSIKYFYLIFVSQFVETELPNTIVNSALLFVLFNAMFQKWTINQVLIMSFIPSTLGSFAAWLFFVSFFPSTRFNGTLPLVTSLAVLAVYSYRTEKIAITGNYSISPQYICAFVAFWILASFRIPPVTSFAACFSGILAYILSIRLQGKLGYPRNEDFSMKSFIPAKATDVQQAQGIIESLGLQNGPELSDAAQQKRLRALRAIEERVRAHQSI